MLVCRSFAPALAEANRTRARSKRITTIGGQNEEDIDSAPFMASSTAAAASAAASSPAAAGASSYATAASSGGGAAFPDSMPDVDPSGSVICTDAILPRLVNVSAEWRAALGEAPVASSSSSAAAAAAGGGAFSSFSGGASLLRRKLDYFKLRSWSINDVFHFSNLRPDLLQRLKLPPVQMPEEFRDLSDAEEETNARAKAKRNAHASAAKATSTFATTTASAATAAGTNPLASFFSSPLMMQLDAYLVQRHPELHSRSVHLQALLTEIYSTSSPLFRSTLQLYSYTMRNLPVQVQHAVRLYLLLMVLRQLMSIWRGYVLVRQGVRVASNVVRSAGQVTRITSRNNNKNKAITAAEIISEAITTSSSSKKKKKKRSFFRSSSRSPSRSSSASGASSRSPSPSPSPSSSSALASRRSRQLDALSEMLSHPQTVKVASLVMDQVLPAPSARLVHEIIGGAVAQQQQRRIEAAAAAATAAAGTATSAGAVTRYESLRPSARSAVRTLLSPTAGSSFSSIPASLTSSSPAAVAASGPALRGRKRAALKSFVQSSATVAFPRLSRLVRFGKEMAQENAAAAATAASTGATPATALPLTSSSSSSSAASSTQKQQPPHARTNSVELTASSASDRSRSPSPSPLDQPPRSRSLSPVTSRHALFAQRHPHLSTLVEQLQLLLVSAVAAQFVDQIRSSL